MGVQHLDLLRVLLCLLVEHLHDAGVVNGLVDLLQLLGRVRRVLLLLGLGGVHVVVSRAGVLLVQRGELQLENVVVVRQVARAGSEAEVAAAGEADGRAEALFV